MRREFTERELSFSYLDFIRATTADNLLLSQRAPIQAPIQEVEVEEEHTKCQKGIPL